MVMVCGIDEAGRGPVIGPMVICGVLIDEKKEHILKEMGVKDSKLLSEIQRKNLFEKIKEVVKDFSIKIVSPSEIDKAVISKESNLNWLEADKSVLIINSLSPGRVILDCPSNNIEKFTEYVKGKLKDKKIEVVSEHKADRNHPCVAAASILAKVTRDAQIEKIKRTFKIDFGSGYPADPFTQIFLEKNYAKYPIFRKSWASWKNVAKKEKQSKLLLF